MTSGSNLTRKIKGDVATIAKVGEPCDVHYFCSEDVAVSQRHAVQAWAKAQFKVHLEIYDRQAISELLCARDTFWIASQYLQVPESIFPIAAKVYQAPPLPAGFVERPELTDMVKTVLLCPHSVVGSLVRCVLHGLPGGGKSTIAAALANDAQVRSHFRDGVLWVTLGEEPSLLDLLSSWLHALGDFEHHPQSIEAMTSRLRSCLHGRRCLLVVDDAWDAGHVEPFLAGGENCRLLLTTRDLLIAQAAGVEIRVEVGELTHDQAMRLIPRCLGRSLGAVEAEEAEKIAILLGHLPLALELVTALVASGDSSWEQVRAAVDAEIMRMAALDPPGVDEVAASLRKRLSLRVSFNLTLQRLPERMQTAFAWLGVLKDDATITAAAAATLWQTSAAEAHDTLRYLRMKGLLLAGSELATFRIHDLLHDAARALLVAPEELTSELKGLGIELARAHATLLERYFTPSEDGSRAWYTVDDDGYICEHLIWHLERAGRIHELHSLFRGAAGFAWYQRRDGLGQTAGYVDDVFHAWRVTRESPEQSLSKRGREIRYALIASSLRSVARQAPLALLIALVRCGVWRVEKAIDYARQIQSPQERNRALLTMAPFVDETERDEVLPELASLGTLDLSDSATRPETPMVRASRATIDIAAAYKAIDFAESTALMLDEEELEGIILLLHDLPKQQVYDLVTRILDTANQFCTEDKDRMLAVIGPYATEQQLVEALQEDPESAAVLAPWLTSPRLLGAAVQGVRGLHGSARTRVVEVLASLLSPALLLEIAPLACRLQDEKERKETALSLALVYARVQAWEPAFRLGASVGSLSSLVEVVAPTVPLDWVRRLLASEAGEGLSSIARGLLSVSLPNAERESFAAELLKEARLWRACDRIEEVGSGWGDTWQVDEGLEEKLSSLLVLVARSGYYLKKVMNTVSDRRRWAHATLVGIAPYSSGEVSDRILSELEPRAYPENGWHNGLSLTESERNWAAAIAPIVNQLGALRQVREIQRARSLEDAPARAKVLSALGAAMGEQRLIDEAKEVVLSIRTPLHQAEAAEGICAFLSESERVGVINEVIASAEVVREYDQYIKVLRLVLPWLPEQERAAAMIIVLEKARPLTINRLRWLEPVGAHLLILDVDVLKKFWQEAVDIAWPHERRVILGCLGVLGYVLVALEGCEGLEEVVDALNDTGEWFP